MSVISRLTPGPRLKRLALTAAGLGLVGALAALLFAWSGLYSVAATSGHWPMTTWFLHYALRNSVETHAFFLKAPPLDDIASIERGAGHYETACAACHGAPGSPGHRVPQNMLPTPPYLPAVVESWTAEELFWIVKNGFKYTGMPAWPAQTRDDEVWAMAAFLQKLPGMPADEYLRLAKGTAGQAPPGSAQPPLPEDSGALFPASEAAPAGTCVRCHGLDGVGRPSGAFPRLDIQEPAYLARALSDYASGARPSGIMGPVAAALDPGEVDQLARYYAYAGRPRPESPGNADAEMLQLGHGIATTGLPDRQIAPCSACHGLQEGPKNPLFPALRGQHAEFIALQLRLWKDGKRGGSAYAKIMDVIVRNLTPHEIEAVALFYERLPATAAPAAPAAGQPQP